MDRVKAKLSNHFIVEIVALFVGTDNPNSIMLRGLYLK